MQRIKETEDAPEIEEPEEIEEDEEVEIKEPPIKELYKARRKKRFGCLRFGCSSGCFLPLIIILGIFALVFFISTGPKQIKTLPENFPPAIKIYNPDRIEKINYLSSKRKNRGLEMAAFIPKIALYPVFRALEIQSAKRFKDIIPENDSAADSAAEIIDAKNFFDFMRAPLGPQTDTIAVEWKNLTADKNFLLDFYTDELNGKSFDLTPIFSSGTKHEFSFSKTVETPKIGEYKKIRGKLIIKESGVDEFKTESMILFVEYEAG